MIKTAIVTGASRGIGKEISKALAQKEHQIIAIARTESELNKLQHLYPNSINSYVIDLTDEAQISKLKKWVEKHYSGIDILINNAGGLINKPFRELMNDDWDRMININLKSVVTLIRILIPLMNEKSHIVNISSMGGFQGSSKFRGLSAYSVVKGAVSILSECLAVELSEEQIRVNSLCLGSVQTEMFNKAFPHFEADATPEAMGTYIAEFALNNATFFNGKILPVALNDPS